MFLSDPEHTPYDVKFTLRGFPVRIHPFFWIMMLFIGAGVGGAQALILWVLAAVVSILLHELGHALAFRLFGIHSSITLYAFGGVTVPAPSYGTRRLRPQDDILISVAGVAFQYALAFLIVLAYAVKNGVSVPEQFMSGAFSGFGMYPDLFLFLLFYISFFWATLNIMPIYPLDGGHISQKILSWLSPRWGMVMTLYLSILFALGLGAYFFFQGSYFGAILFGSLAYSNMQMLSPRNY